MMTPVFSTTRLSVVKEIEVFDSKLSARVQTGYTENNTADNLLSQNKAKENSIYLTRQR